MDHLKEGIGLRGYGQKDPLLEYKKEGFMLFGVMMNTFTEDVVKKLFRVQVTSEESIERAAKAGRAPAASQESHHVNPSAFAASAPRESQGNVGATQGTVKHDAPKVGRNDPCPCGSGKKYKKCHG
jgi:preprotein translocase subunit SecA